MFFKFYSEWEHLGYDLKGCEYRSQTERLEAMLFQATFYNNYGGGNIYTRGNFEYAQEMWSNIVQPMNAAHGQGQTLSVSACVTHPDEFKSLVSTLVEFYTESDPLALDEDWHESWEYETLQEELETTWLPYWLADLQVAFNRLTSWDNTLLPEGVDAELWSIYANIGGDSAYPYFETPEDVVVEGLPDVDEIIMELLCQYGDELFAIGGTPPMLAGFAA